MHRYYCEISRSSSRYLVLRKKHTDANVIYIFERVDHISMITASIDSVEKGRSTRSSGQRGMREDHVRLENKIESLTTNSSEICKVTAWEQWPVCSRPQTRLVLKAQWLLFRKSAISFGDGIESFIRTFKQPDTFSANRISE